MNHHYYLQSVRKVIQLIYLNFINQTGQRILWVTLHNVFPWRVSVPFQIWDGKAAAAVAMLLLHNRSNWVRDWFVWSPSLIRPWVCIYWVKWAIHMQGPLKYIFPVIFIGLILMFFPADHNILFKDVIWLKHEKKHQFYMTEMRKHYFDM